VGRERLVKQLRQHVAEWLALDQSEQAEPPVNSRRYPAGKAHIAPCRLVAVAAVCVAVSMHSQQSAMA